MLDKKYKYRGISTQKMYTHTHTNTKWRIQFLIIPKILEQSFSDISNESKGDIKWA